MTDWAAHHIFSQRPEIATHLLVSRLRLQNSFFFSSLPLCFGLKPHLLRGKRGGSVPILFLLKAAEYAIKVNICNRGCTFWLPDYSCIQVLVAIYEAAAHVRVSVWLGRKILLFSLQACCILT